MTDTMSNTDRPVAERLVIRYLHNMNLREVAKTGRDRANIDGRMHGIAEAADILGLCMTPFAFEMAVRDAVRNVGHISISAGTPREEAKRLRDRYYDEVIAFVTDSDAVDLNVEV